jgi:hypothetical protein
MRAHFGNPPRSLLTWITEAMLRVQELAATAFNRQPSPAGVLPLLQHVCSARDRHRLYLKVRRFAAAGGIAVCEHYPVRENRTLMGPRIAPFLAADPGHVAATLRKIEASYYHRMVRPDSVCVLQLDSDEALRRKPDQPPERVREHARLLEEVDWTSTGAHVIDASLPLTEVLRQVKSILWQVL